MSPETSFLQSSFGFTVFDYFLIFMTLLGMAEGQVVEMDSEEWRMPDPQTSLNERGKKTFFIFPEDVGKFLPTADKFVEWTVSTHTD